MGYPVMKSHKRTSGDSERTDSQGQALIKLSGLSF